ncbi:MAG TPA: pyruvate dehydrogenase (acetyl-transferring), homodimeric type, partial [Deltaproteobacteria bacterium]|nr:pyruvate dehydrogenase (acetyl-transferring), homodimeric type [Deltaproteobacteria bacterium]
RWNRLHPDAAPKKSYLESVLENESGPFIAASDFMKAVPDQIARWVPGGLLSLGTDGYGRSETREALRRFFEVDAEHIVVAALSSLAERGKIEKRVVAQAIQDLGVEVERPSPVSL